METNRRVLNLTTITDGSNLNAINQNFRKIQSELSALNHHLEPMAKDGKEVKDYLTNHLQGDAPVGRVESFEYTEDFTIEYAQKKITSQSEPPENPEDGDLWIDNSTSPPTFLRWSGSIEDWEPLSTASFEDLEGMLNYDQLPDGIIDSVKIAVGGIGEENILDGTVSASKIQANAVTSDAIAANAILTLHLAAGAVTANEIAAEAVTTDALAVGAILSKHISSKAVEAEHLDVENLSAITADLGEVTAGNITGVNITGSSITSNSTIDVTTDISIGKKLTIDWSADNTSGIYFKDAGSNIIGSIRRTTYGGILFTNEDGHIDFEGFRSINDASFLQDVWVDGRINFLNGHSIETSPTGNWFFRGNRSAGEPFVVRSHSNGTGHRNELRVGSDGFIYTRDRVYVGGDRIQVTGGSENFIQGDNRLTLHAVGGARIMIGYDSSSNRIWSPHIYSRTYSANANVHITNEGTLGRSTSASKYKLNISDIEENLAENILNINPKKWFDKASSEQYADFLTKKHHGECGDEYLEENDIPQIRPHYGLKAEDLVDNGLEMYVEYGKDGEAEGIEYDRLWTLLIPLVRGLKEKVEHLEAELNGID